MVVLDWLDIVTTAIFIGEAVLKIVALGFAFNGPWSYLK
jgi:Ion transport protein